MQGSGIRRRLTYANLMATLAVIIAITGTSTAVAAVIISSNSEVAQDTISGHKPPVGDHSNIIGGSINATDLANKSVTAAKLKPQEAWHEVAPGSTTASLCDDPSNTAMFCSYPDVQGYLAWHNYGGAGLATAGFYKDSLGIVHLKGLVTAPFLETRESPGYFFIFRLPPGYTPTHSLIFASVGTNFDGLDVAPSRIDVRSDGLVEWEQDCDGFDANTRNCSADGAFMTLDGISFRPDE